MVLIRSKLSGLDPVRFRTAQARRRRSTDDHQARSSSIDSILLLLVFTTTINFTLTTRVASPWQGAQSQDDNPTSHCLRSSLYCSLCGGIGWQAHAQSRTFAQTIASSHSHRFCSQFQCYFAFNKS